MSELIHHSGGGLRNQRFRDYTRQRQYGTGDILLDNRIIFFGCSGSNVYEPVVNDLTANLVIQQMLYLQYENKNQEIHFYINSPGDMVSSMLAIYDTMQFLDCPVVTYCMGMAASMGSFLLAAGRHGKRSALPHSRIMMHQPSGGTQGTAADIEIQAREILYLRTKLNQLYAKHTGKPAETIEKDMDRDRFMSAEEAKEYGLIDHVIAHQAELDGKKKA